MSTGTRWGVNAGIEKTASLVRRCLRDRGLQIVDEVYISSGQCVVLLVDTPELLLGAVALDRGAAVLVPVHVVITSDGPRSFVYWANPIAVSGLRPPASARAALERLCGRIRQTLAQSLEGGGNCLA
jgi:hypothetical protein